MHQYCQQGKNSLAKGSETVDIVLDNKMRPDLEKNNEAKNEAKNEDKSILPNYSAK